VIFQIPEAVTELRRNIVGRTFVGCVSEFRKSLALCLSHRMSGLLHYSFMSPGKYFTFKKADIPREKKKRKNKKKKTITVTQVKLIEAVV